MPNGLRVVAAPRHAFPQVAMRLVLPVGAMADAPAHPGTASMTAEMMTEGTERRSAEELNARLDSLGASLGVSAGHDFSHVEMLLLAETLPEGIELMAEVLTRPSFPADELERARAEALDALEARGDEPANVADDRTTHALFGDHPYGRLAAGTVPGIESLDPALLADFHRAHYRPEGAALVVAGAFDPEELQRLLERSLGDWRGSAPARPSPPIPPVAAAGELLQVEWPDAAQAELRVAGPGLARTAPEWIPAAVANYILGGSTITSRLGANLREQKGWTYGVRAGFAAGIQPGGWAVETAVERGVAAAALEEILREIERLIHDGVPAAELRRAKEAMILSLPRAFETASRVVSRFATLEAYDLPRDYWERYAGEIEAVDEAAVVGAAAALFAPERLVRVQVG
jgi:zinc protease